MAQKGAPKILPFNSLFTDDTTNFIYKQSLTPQAAHGTDLVNSTKKMESYFSN